MTVEGFLNSRRCIGDKLAAAFISFDALSTRSWCRHLEELRRELTADIHRAGSHSVHRWFCWAGPDCVSGNIGLVLREQPQASGGPRPIARRGRVLGREMSLRSQDSSNAPDAGLTCWYDTLLLAIKICMKRESACIVMKRGLARTCRIYRSVDNKGAHGLASSRTVGAMTDTAVECLRTCHA